VKIGVLVLNFGEPDEPTLEKIVPFLERIFLQNMDLEHMDDPEAGRRRARQLAEARAPGLIEEYEEIGGSPLNAQAHAQAQALVEEIRGRGWDANLYSAMQFTEPSIPSEVARAKADGVEKLIGLPVYPICGQSTNVAALDEAQRAVEALDWDVEFMGLTGWHSHPDYLDLRAEVIRVFAGEKGLDLTDPDTILYFSAHGTPLKYIQQGNRYDQYVDECCREVAERLGVGDRYAVGFQNHANRGVPWTQPDNEPRIEALTESRMVVDAISFMREQSETLAELDHELKEFSEDLGKEFHRVPVPHAHPGFVRFLADMVEAVMDAHEANDGNHPLVGRCRCRPVPGTWCMNGPREFPPSPFLPTSEA
jgi:ferrochelatase